LQRGYFKPEAVRALVDEHVSERRNRSGLLWRLLVLELWHRNFLEAGQYGIRPEPSLALAPEIPAMSVSGEIRHHPS